MTQRQSEVLPARRYDPRPQENVRTAVARGWEAFGRQTADQVAWLGGVPLGNCWQLAVLDQTLVLDPASGRMTTSAGVEVRPEWQVLVLHYLAVSGRPEPRPPEVSFADLPSGRGYGDVYDKRVLKRLCATAGRDAATLRRAAGGLAAREVPGGDVAFHLVVFPRLPIRIIWFAPDEEFPPSATLLLPDNVEQFLCTEDIVVLCERCVARLAGRPL